MLRYSLGSLFLVLVYLSVGCAALVNATGIWPQVAITLTLAILVVFSLRAVFGSERWRVFSIGFVATGWLYILLVFSSVTSIRPYLLTETATNKLFQVMHGDQPTSYSFVVRTTAAPNGGGSVQRLVYTAQSPSPVPGPSLSVYATPAQNSATPLSVGSTVHADAQSFANIGHSLWTIILAFAGGITAQLLAQRRKQVDVAAV